MSTPEVGRGTNALDRSPRSHLSLHAQMHNLRAKVERDPGAPVLIKTIKGVGFELDVAL